MIVLPIHCWYLLIIRLVLFIKTREYFWALPTIRQPSSQLVQQKRQCTFQSCINSWQSLRAAFFLCCSSNESTRLFCPAHKERWAIVIWSSTGTCNLLKDEGDQIYGFLIASVHHQISSGWLFPKPDITSRHRRDFIRRPVSGQAAALGFSTHPQIQCQTWSILQVGNSRVPPPWEASLSGRAHSRLHGAAAPAPRLRALCEGFARGAEAVPHCPSWWSLHRQGVGHFNNHR